MDYPDYEVIPLRNNVLAWDRIADIIAGANAHVAGGYVSWHMSNRFTWNHLGASYEPTEVVYRPEYGTPMQSNAPTDLDIFTYTPEGFDHIEQSLNKKGFEPVADSICSSTWRDSRNFLGTGNYSHLRHALEDHRNYVQERCGHETAWATRTSLVSPGNYPKLPINVIKPLFGDSLVKVLDHFDFYLVKFALLDGKTALAHSKATSHLDARTLISSCPDSIVERPFYTLGRYLKYAQKGYKVNYMDLFRSVVTAQELGCNDADVKYAEIRELVKLFGKYLKDGVSLTGRGEDFRPTFQDAYGEWLSYCNEKKLN
jgi:hypothetical protein